MEPEIPYPQTLKSEEQKKGEDKENDEVEEYEKLLEMLMKITPPSNIEEEMRNRQEELDLKIVQAFQEFWEKEDISYQKRMEQESRDHESLLLSQQHCDCKEVMDRNMKRSPLEQSIHESQGRQMYDLTILKYSELKDTINSSCDIELLEACKIEFHRRLKMYHAWKAKNRKRDDNQRAQSSILGEEKRDHELALRLAKENHDEVEDINNIEKRSPLVRSIQEAQGKQKYDLTKWKYSELRDTINSSCDIELLEACKIEFHRRLKVYHAWKAKNRKRDDNQRAQSSILGEGNNNNVTQRYFRIPFVRPTEIQAARGEERGWWYAHFDGQYVARQMELHPVKPAILLTAGSDDMQMCELSLDETGLTRKRGAEILEQEFNHEWEKYGGKPYNRPADRKK